MSETLAYEQEFVEHELQEWGSLVETRLEQALDARGVGVTDALRASLAFRVMRGSGSNKGSYQLLFNESGRMVDMGSGRGVRGLQSDTRKESAVKKSNANVRKPKKWYSKTFYGSLNNLITRLSRNYAEYAANRATEKPVK